jgi:endonuclease/exonuclease/phosphatase family metal-dependent hydrolase
MITVASYNIRKAIGTDRLRKPERIIAVLNEIDADIVVLQEADRRFGARAAAIPLEMIASESDFRPVPFDSRKDSIGWHGNAILVKSGIEVRKHRVLDIPALEPRGAVVADLLIGDAELRIVGMHLDLSGLWRRRQARSILAQLEEMSPKIPQILMGDLNEWTAHRGCLVDFAHKHRIAHTAPSFHTRRPVARLDRIMAGPGIELLASGTHHSLTAKRASDHYPVWARIAVR